MTYDKNILLINPMFASDCMLSARVNDTATLFIIYPADTNELDHDDSEVVYEYYERMRDHEEKDIDFEDNERRGYRGKKPRKEKKMREERKHDQIKEYKEKKKEIDFEDNER